MAELEKIAVSAKEAAEMISVSRPTIYTLMNREDFPSFKVGTRTLIPVDGLREWVRAQAGNGQNNGAPPSGIIS